MRKVFVIAAMLAAVLAIQNAVAAQTVDGGVKGGVIFADIPKLTADFKGEGAVDLRYRYGILAGGFVAIHATDKFAFQTEVLYAQKGMHGKDPIGDEVFEFRLDYVDIPLLASFHASRDRGFYVLAGPSFGLNVRAKAFDEGIGEEDIKDVVEKIEVSLVIGGGVRFTRFLVEGRYTEGLTNIVKDSEEEYRNRSFAVIIAVCFR